MARYIEDPKGRRRKIHYIPNLNGFGANACVRISLFRKTYQYAAGPNIVDNLVRRLEAEGWKVVEE